MIKELIGIVTTFFVMLPFLLLNRVTFKIKDLRKLIFVFLIINFIQVAFLLLLAYGLFIVGQKCLIGMLIVFMIYLFLFLILVFTNIRKRKINKSSEEDDIFSDDELFETQNLSRTQEVKDNIKKEMDIIENDNILEENQYTMAVEEPDFSKIEKEEVLKNLEDIFKEM